MKSFIVATSTIGIVLWIAVVILMLVMLKASKDAEEYRNKISESEQ